MQCLMYFSPSILCRSALGKNGLSKPGWGGGQYHDSTQDDVQYMEFSTKEPGDTAAITVYYTVCNYLYSFIFVVLKSIHKSFSLSELLSNLCYNMLFTREALQFVFYVSNDHFLDCPIVQVHRDNVNQYANHKDENGPMTRGKRRSSGSPQQQAPKSKRAAFGDITNVSTVVSCVNCAM